MKNLEQYLDEVAKEIDHCNDFEDLLIGYTGHGVCGDDFKNAIKDAMQRAIEDACKEQKEIIANIPCYFLDDNVSFIITKDKILTAPSPTFKK